MRVLALSQRRLKQRRVQEPSDQWVLGIARRLRALRLSLQSYEEVTSPEEERVKGSTQNELQK